ncbi:MAG TPA: D-alanyl-D-alanine carboxypeptidase/D-alanyl-D-alanine-endopeptidase [Pyrinomonadaceae bacterium]|nr:D-alanyl-D-alanine carboxypeptidase/D-alanyl-D-alanine-endopeptidase [Pyrinomonadaceae bacterium]
MIKQNRITALISLLLIYSLLVAATVTAGAQRRDRRAASQPSPTPTPTPAVATPSPLQTPSPSPTASPVVRSAATTKTLEELRARITDVLQKPELSSAMVGIKVASLDTGRTLFEQNAVKLLRPASNLKLYTVATALDRLSPDYRFNTSVYAANRPDAAGILHGDLTIYGRGDPTIAARFSNGDYFQRINELAARIAATGLKRVEGDLVGDETYFIGPKYGSGWNWEDLQWWYGAEVSSLTINDNALDLSIKPGPSAGSPAIITTGPPDPLLTIVNRVTTGPKSSRRELAVHRDLNADTLELYGSIPLDDSGYTRAIGISHPSLLFIYLLRTALAQRGVTITGKSRTVPAPAYANASLTANPTGPIEIASLQSPPLSVVAAETLKRSQNLYTELILRTLGKAVPPPPASTSSSANSSSIRPANASSTGAAEPQITATVQPTPRTSEEGGLEVVKTFLKEAGASSDVLSLDDGSGLSRNNMVTAEATVQLLIYMNRHRYATAFRDALPIAGVDGTLRGRMRGTLAANNVRAKTGTLSSAASLAGYVTTAAGENLVFSIIVNNYPSDVDPPTVCIDPIMVLLASFAGRS